MRKHDFFSYLFERGHPISKRNKARILSRSSLTRSIQADIPSGSISSIYITKRQAQGRSHSLFIW